MRNGDGCERCGEGWVFSSKCGASVVNGESENMLWCGCTNMTVVCLQFPLNGLYVNR